MFFKHNATASWERLWKMVLSTHLYKRDKHIKVRLTGGYHIPWRSAAEVHPPRKKRVVNNKIEFYTLSVVEHNETFIPY